MEKQNKGYFPEKKNYFFTLRVYPTLFVSKTDFRKMLEKLPKTYSSKKSLKELYEKRILVPDRFFKKIIFGHLELIEILKVGRLKFLTLLLLEFGSSKFYETSYGYQIGDFH